MSKRKEFQIELFFAALADRTRLRLLNLLGNEEVCVCFLVEALRMQQPKISRHLSYLRRAGIVTARREGKWMHYRIVDAPDKRAAIVFSTVRAWLLENQEMQSDRERLVKMCCVEPPIRIRRAPVPAGVTATG